EVLLLGDAPDRGVGLLDEPLQRVFALLVHFLDQRALAPLDLGRRTRGDVLGALLELRIERLLKLDRGARLPHHALGVHESHLGGWGSLGRGKRRDHCGHCHRQHCPAPAHRISSFSDVDRVLPNSFRRRLTPSGSPRTRKYVPSPSLRSSSTAQVSKMRPRCFCADQGRKSSASTSRCWKCATIFSRSRATSSGRRALITTQPGCSAPNDVSRLAASPAWSILLKTSSFGTSSAPISASTSSVTMRWRSKPGSLASTTCSSSEASSASSSVDLNDATRPCGRFLMKPTVSLTSTRGTLSGCSARTVVSSVAKSLFATSTSLPVSARMSVDLPALV